MLFVSGVWRECRAVISSVILGALRQHLVENAARSSRKGRFVVAPHCS